MVDLIDGKGCSPWTAPERDSISLCDPRVAFYSAYTMNGNSAAIVSVHSLQACTYLLASCYSADKHETPEFSRADISWAS